ncbi:hypothetical protein [Spirillospora sp. NBC_01491]|uniref:hypothetical protein n=1 Tax=Spirillospora sp. NBC_01491 TaxID=2976007 RepID=UPI002E37E549|nr:hypothetical protein [Spirillospora sp. NBC_01491]
MSDDLRDRIADALYRWTVEQAAGGPNRLLRRDERILQENSLARADAVTPVVEELLAEHERQVREQVGAVYIAESIWFDDNPVDGRTRLATCLSLDEALAAIKGHGIFGEPNLVATVVEDSALHGEGGRTWAVHPEGQEPNDEGHLWITEEKITRGGA